MWFQLMGRQVIIYILLLPLANVFLSIIIVSFAWNTIQGSGVVEQNDVCHGSQVDENSVRILLTSIHPAEQSYHPISRTPMEVGSWTIIPLDKLDLISCILSKWYLS